MHEMAITENIIRIVREKLGDMPVKGHTVTVTVVIGKLTAVIPETLKFCFNIMTKESEFSDIILVVREVSVHGRCRKCQDEFLIEEIRFNCPHCSGTEIDLTSGRELLLESIELD
jgi:hydrogenase nickel incorporation protein HypA/HybF